MDDNERDNMYIANCKACTLAPGLRLCKICWFQIGLAFKIMQAQPLSADCLLRIEEIRGRFLAEINLYDCEKC